MSDDDDDDDVGETGYVPVAEALEQTGFTLAQLRALTQAGIVAKRMVSGKTVYAVDDLKRLTDMPRRAEPDDDQPPIALEYRALTDGFKAMLELALKQTRQAQEHERQLIAAFSKPLENLGDSSKSLVTAVLEQNKQLVTRANEGDVARLDFVKAAEGMLRDQRVELREQAELDRKHALKAEVWEGVKKAAPHLLAGLQQTTGAGRLEAAAKLKEKLDPAKVAAIIKFQLLSEEEISLMCTALDLDRAELDKLNAEADAAPPEPQAAE